VTRLAAQRTRSGAGSDSRLDGARPLLAALLVALLAAAPLPALADGTRDTLPFRVAYGQPAFTSGDEVACYFWSQGGRLHLRISADTVPHKVEGELRTGGGGVFEDVAPLTENLRVRQPRPTKLLFDVRTERQEEGFDVTLTGNFRQVTVDLLIDGVRNAQAFRIGGQRTVPAALPARLDLRGGTSTWLERFGF
jgi:hypothetical protein